ncbi:MAG: alkaline phosphatase family protein [Acidimicrobiia bacterium]|nr:alkaline phosphatase family protein [Acidimicrobiia bacterium]
MSPPTHERRRLRAAVALMAVVAALGVSAVAPSPAGSAAAVPAGVDDRVDGEAASTPTATPIKHFITLMQENHSFDNYFGTYPGADGFAPDTCVPVDPDVAGGSCVEPFWLGDQPITDLGHTSEVFEAQFAGGDMDGFVEAFADRNEEAGEQTVGYYDDRDLPYYWNLADEYVLFDRFFTSAHGGSVRNHFYWVAAHPGNTEEDGLRAEGFDEVRTIFDELQAAGVSWKFYVQNYDPEINFRNPVTGPRAAQRVWVPLLNYNRFLDDPELSSRIVGLDQYFEDLATGQLPSVAYIVPSGASEHPPGSIQAGERFVRSLIDALMRSSAWESSAFTWTYDDWGGWYDHVAPPQVDEFGYGFRAPALLVSPYARRGHIDSTTLDFTSLLTFIENNWGVPPLAARDATANDIVSAFDFDQAPREPALLGRSRETPPRPPSNAGVIYGTYAAAPLASAALAAALGLGRRRRRGRGRWAHDAATSGRRR